MPRKTWRIRDGAADDLPALVRLDTTIDTTWQLRLVREGSDDDLRLTLSWSKSFEPSTRRLEHSVASLTEDLTSSSAFIVAERQGTPVAFCMVGTNWNRTAEVLDIIVDAPSRKRGIGGAMLDRASAFARRGGLRAVQWEIQSDNRAAIDVARRRGFRLAGYHDALYHNDGYEAQTRPGFRGLALFFTLPMEP